MGNTKSQARGSTSARGPAPAADDPFAELANIFETELQHDPRFAEDGRGQRAGASRRDGGEYGFDNLDSEFEAAFATDLAATRGQRPSLHDVPAYETRINGRSTARAAPARKVAGARPSHLTDEEIDNELESVLRNLSAPAKPRGRIVVETQSFAPERAAEERLPPAPQPEADEFEELIRSELAVIRPAMMHGAGRQARYAEPSPSDEFEADPVDDRYAAGIPAGRSAWKRRLAAGASAAVFLLLAGVGYTAWHSAAPGETGMAGDEPLLIKADAEPFKIVPKDPGGRAYPNQNKAVYDRVAAPKGNIDTPMQQALLKNVEEPIELPVEEEGRTYAENLPGVELGEVDEDGEGGKDQTRVSASTESGSETVLQPRKVRTMTVGPDGKLVASEASPQPSEAINQIASLAVNAAKPTPAAEPHKAPTPTRAPEPTQTAALSPPATQPERAAAEAPSAPMPANGFFVQVSSQPTEAAAQQSMRAFGSRYGSLVGGRPLGIQAGEVAGKGTYWRVRVSANSKEEAGSLCTKLKGAGASCFVTR